LKLIAEIKRQEEVSGIIEFLVLRNVEILKIIFFVVINPSILNLLKNFD